MDKREKEIFWYWVIHLIYFVIINIGILYLLINDHLILGFMAIILSFRFVRNLDDDDESDVEEIFEKRKALKKEKKEARRERRKNKKKIKAE